MGGRGRKVGQVDPDLLAFPRVAGTAGRGGALGCRGGGDPGAAPRLAAANNRWSGGRAGRGSGQWCWMGYVLAWPKKRPA